MTTAAVIVCLVVSGLATFGVTHEKAKSVRHARCLANIARLETELGIRPAPPAVRTYAELAAHYVERFSVPPPPSQMEALRRANLVQHEPRPRGPYKGEIAAQRKLDRKLNGQEKW